MLDFGHLFPPNVRPVLAPAGSATASAVLQVAQSHM